MRTLDYASTKHLRDSFEHVAEQRHSQTAPARAVTSELKAKYEEISAALRSTDGSEASMVSLLTGLSRERLEELGGI